MKKKRALKNMDIEEVSLVDRPANKRKFLLIKREDGEITELTIKTDGTADGTELSVNGTEVKDLKAFWFSLWPSDDFDEGMMNGSYTVAETDGAEFDRETTFHLKKGNTMKLETVLKSLAIEPASLSSEQTQDLESVLKFVDLMPPEDGAATLNIIKASLVKEEAVADEEEPEETPPETEELPPEKIAEIRSAMAQLNDMLPEDQRAVIKAEEPDKLDAILAAIIGLKKEEGDDPADDTDDPPDSIKDILKRLIKVEETTGNSEEGEDEEEAETESGVPLTSEERVKKYGSKYPKALTTWGHHLLQSQ